MFGKPVKTECVRVLAVAKMTSPSVAHELAITTADEKSLAIFRRVSKTTKSQEVLAMVNPSPTALVSPL
jgi:hypothetical protein